MRNASSVSDATSVSTTSTAVAAPPPPDSTDATPTIKKNRLPPRADSVIYRTSIVGDVSVGRSWERRYQTVAMFTASLYFIMPMVMTSWILSLAALYYGNPWTRCFMAMYLGYINVLDKSPTTGTRTPWLRNFKNWWRHACDYLPLLLVKTAELPQDRKYVMGYHPHGIISVGAFCAFATDSARTLDLTTTAAPATTKKMDTTKTEKEEANNKEDSNESCSSSPSSSSSRGFSSLFPGIDRRILTLPQNFTTPFLREYFLCMGACNSSKESFRNVLSKETKTNDGTSASAGNAIIVVVGGAAESLIVHEGSMDLILERRRGFVREAIMAQADLVPVLGFGESDLYHVFDVDQKSKLAWLQRTVKAATGMAMPIFRGRSVFLKHVGIMANRKPVCVVVGAPIRPPILTKKKDSKLFAPSIDRKTDEALNEDGKILKEWHAKYMTAVKELEAKYRRASWNIPGQNQTRSLNITR